MTDRGDLCRTKSVTFGGNIMVIENDVDDHNRIMLGISQ